MEPGLNGGGIGFWYEKRATLCCSSLSALYAAYIQFISSTSWIFHCWSGLWVTLPWSCLLICVPTVSLKCIVFQSLHIPTKCLSSPMIGANLCPPKLTDSNQPKIILTWMILSKCLCPLAKGVDRWRKVCHDEGEGGNNQKISSTGVINIMMMMVTMILTMFRMGSSPGRCWSSSEEQLRRSPRLAADHFYIAWM